MNEFSDDYRQGVRDFGAFLEVAVWLQLGLTRKQRMAINRMYTAYSERPERYLPHAGKHNADPA